MVTNLVVNAQQALQASPAPRRISVITRFDQDAGTIRLMVADNGPGVPDDIRSRIFDPFFTTKPAGLGTGVGLSLVHNIVYGHGGTIVLEETPGGGATFAAELPVRAASSPATLPEQPETPSRTGALRLLIVDDDPEIALTLAEMLEPDGHAIDIAENGAEALERLEDQSYDLIISDLRMPELDGPGLYRELGARFPEMQRQDLLRHRRYARQRRAELPGGNRCAGSREAVRAGGSAQRHGPDRGHPAVRQ